MLTLTRMLINLHSCSSHLLGITRGSVDAHTRAVVASNISRLAAAVQVILALSV